VNWPEFYLVEESIPISKAAKLRGSAFVRLRLQALDGITPRELRSADVECTQVPREQGWAWNGAAPADGTMVVLDDGFTKVDQLSGLEDPARYVAQLLSPEGTAKFL
jgi:hypothetical protein